MSSLRLSDLRDSGRGEEKEECREIEKREAVKKK